MSHVPTTLKSDMSARDKHASYCKIMGFLELYPGCYFPQIVSY